MRVAERRDDGVVIRGAKLHIPGGSFAHDLLVMPTKAMKPGEEDYSICAAVFAHSLGMWHRSPTWRNPEIGPAVRKNMTTGERADGEYRLRLFDALRDLTADAYGAWRLVTNMQGGGGLYAQRIVTGKHFDMTGAKEAALRYVGLQPPERP